MYIYQVLSEDQVVVAAKAFTEAPTAQQQQEALAQLLPDYLVFAFHSDRVIQL